MTTMNKLNKTLKLFISCHLILLQVSVVLSRSQTRIVGGNSTTIDKAPYLVQIFKDGRFNCGGTLVSDDCVVSAAHCFDGYNPSSFVIVGGATKLTDYGIRSKISKVIISGLYNPNKFHMDIAVVKLATPIKGESVQPVALCESSWKHGDPVQLYGWGKTTESGSTIPLQLRTVTVNAIEKGQCEAMYRNRRSLTDSMFCAAGPGKDACSGDSGGPAMINGRLCGVVSWGIGCGRSDSPGVYTNVLELKDFITNAMNKMK